MNESAYRFISTTLIAGAVFCLFLGFMVWTLFRVTAEDQSAYQALVLAANPTNTRGQPSPYVATQKRKQVRKDILFSQGNERLQLRLFSGESDMILDHQTDKTELIEKMRDVSCLMQQELYYLLPDGREALLQSNGKLLVRDGNAQDPSDWSDKNEGVKPMQQLRYIEAREATYHYKSETLLADHVYIARYVIPGHHLELSLRQFKPIGTATADHVEFSLSGKEINYKATRMKMKLNHGEKSL